MIAAGNEGAFITVSAAAAAACCFVCEDSMLFALCVNKNTSFKPSCN